MNRLLTSKKLLSKDVSLLNYHKKEKVGSPSIKKKYKENKHVKAKIKKALKQTVLSDGLENCFNNNTVNELQNTEDCVYVGTYKTDLSDYGNIPIVDLTNSPQKLNYKESFVNSKKLKTIFFPKRNFERNIRLKKSLATTSLITIPVIKKIVPQKLKSTTVIGKYRNRVSILDIPAQFLNWDDLSYNNLNALKKCDLTESDNEMIHWILDWENENFELDVTLTPASSGYSSLDTGMSIEEMINVYNVSSADGF